MNKVLMYHSIGETNSREAGAGLYCVSEDRFREQMKYIAKCSSAPVLQCSVTFDDGAMDNYTVAYPVFKEMDITAYFFIIVSKVGTKGFMNWEQIKELKDSGMIIGSHGMTHQILSGLSEGDLDYEIRISKKILEEKLKCAIDYFSVPRGFYNQDVIKQTKDNGYKNIFTSNSKDNDGFKIGRIPVKGSWDMEYFIKVLSNGISLKDKAGEMIRNSSKRLLGAKYYDKVRTAILKK